jgi:hypothetical protein
MTAQPFNLTKIKMSRGRTENLWKKIMTKSIEYLYSSHCLITFIKFASPKNSIEALFNSNFLNKEIERQEN